MTTKSSYNNSTIGTRSQQLRLEIPARSLSSDEFDYEDPQGNRSNSNLSPLYR